MNADQFPDRLLATASREVVPLQTSTGNTVFPLDYSTPQNQQALHAKPALENFLVLLRSMDFDVELNMLGVKRLLFWRRRRLRNEFYALTIGLWRLALERSFPEHWQRIFNGFMEHWLNDLDDEKAKIFTTTVNTYLILLEKKRDADFTEVGAYMVELLKLPEKNAVALRLRLALHIRSLYTLVFDRLI